MTTPITNFSLTSLCIQRKKQLLFNIPPPRYNPVSPYTNGQYTQQQLDMRRKGEILKYSNNSSSTKTNNDTKSQNWAKLVKGNTNTQTTSFQKVNLVIIDYKGNYQTVTIQYPDTYKLIPTTQYITDTDGNLVYDYLGRTTININAYRVVGLNGYYFVNIISNNLPNCPFDDLIPTPTSSSDIPGPITYLINDETVPLYNYQKKTQTFSYDTNFSQTDKWFYNPEKNILLPNGVATTIFSLMISNQADLASYTYSLQIPFSIFVSGTNISQNVLQDLSENPVYFPNLALGINSMSFNVKYSDSNIKFLSPPVINIQTNHSTTTLIYNDGIYNLPTNTNIYPLQWDISFSTPPTQSTDSYYANVYSGIINISDIHLSAEPGFVYDFQLQIYATDIQFSSNNQKNYYNSAIQNTNYGFFMNTTPNNNITNNTVLYPSPNMPILDHIILSGV